MKLFAILAIVATVLLPALPASATQPSVSCTGGPETTNNQSSLSSTSAGGQSCTVLNEEVVIPG
jgi:hypothetical protein